MHFIIIFLNERRQDCAPFLLVKEFISKRSQRSENRSKKKYIIQKYNKRSQAPLKNEARRFAPAIPQARASSLILSSKFVADCSFRWKVRALRSFQISQTTKSIRERNPLRGTRSCSQHQPPLKHTITWLPMGRSKLRVVCPISDHHPDASCVATIGEQVVGCFLALSAKWATIIPRPSPSRKAVRSPHSVSHHKPCEEFAFWRCPRLPN